MALESGIPSSIGGARPDTTVGRSRLIGHRGVGVLQVWRGQHGQTLEVAGSWRHELDDPEDAGELEALQGALRDGRAVRFEGRLSDPGHPERDTVSVEVRISSMSEFDYVVEPEDPRSPTVHVRLVNFRPVGGIDGG